MMMRIQFDFWIPKLSLTDRKTVKSFFWKGACFLSKPLEDITKFCEQWDTASLYGFLSYIPHTSLTIAKMLQIVLRSESEISGDGNRAYSCCISDS